MEMVKMLMARVDVWIYLAMGLLFLSGILFCLLPVKKIQKALDDSWNRFLTNLELMRKNNAVCEVYEFINPQTAIHEPGHSAYGEMIPGMLTTLGIVGSFYGIVQGLSTLDLSTTETMSMSIAVLISGMGR